MSVRKRTWRNDDGSQGEAWVAAYTDHEKKRRLRSFATKREADAFHAGVAGELRAGIHVPDSRSVTVTEAGRLWLDRCAADGLERSTREGYQQHLDRHITPLIGATKLSRLSVPMIYAFEERLRREGRSHTMARKVLISLGALLADARKRGLASHNAVYELRNGRRGRGKDRARGVELRATGKLQIGVDYPLPVEVRVILSAIPDVERTRSEEAAAGRKLYDGLRPLLMTAIFTGLRISELRGLRWDNVDLDRAELHVRQRADRYDVIGPVKSKAAFRTLPLSPGLVLALRKWKLACPNGPQRLVFPAARDGGVESYVSMVRHALVPVMRAAKLMVPAFAKDGTPRRDLAGLPALTTKYDWHALRHFYASWCINRKVDGGIELPPKMVQERMGHASIAITLDIYGHLFPRGDDGTELAEAERALLG